MYFIRSFKEPDARNFEQYLNGEKDIQLGYAHPDYIPSEGIERKDFGSPIERQAYLKNVERLREVGSYFFYSDDLDSLRNDSMDLFFSPSSEDGILAIKHGRAKAESYAGKNYVSTLILKVPDDVLTPYIESGSAEFRQGVYGDDYFEFNQKILDEVIMGDEAFKKCVESGTIIAYDECHKVFNGPLFRNERPFDAKNIFDASYKPDPNTIVEPIIEEQAYTKKQKLEEQEVHDWFEGLSEEDQKLFSDYRDWKLDGITKSKHSTDDHDGYSPL